MVARFGALVSTLGCLLGAVAVSRRGGSASDSTASIPSRTRSRSYTFRPFASRAVSRPESIILRIAAAVGPGRAAGTDGTLEMVRRMVVQTGAERRVGAREYAWGQNLQEVGDRDRVCGPPIFNYKGIVITTVCQSSKCSRICIVNCNWR